MRSRSTRRVTRLTCAALLAGAVAACAPVVQQHGYAPLPQELAEIRPGVDTRASVQQKIGRPASTGIFTDQGWYYVASTVERLTYHAPKVVDRRVVAVMFDPNNVVTSVNEYGLQDGRVIDLATQTTPTYGRQLSILEQAFGNLGVMTGSVFGDDQTRP